MKQLPFLIVFCFSFFLLLAPAWAQNPANPTKWEKAIQKYEAADSLNMPAPGGMVFTGSSSIVGWKSLPGTFPEHNIIMRGFGGSGIADATYYFDRIVAKYQPKQVFLYSGDNDVAGGHSAESTFELFKAFADKMKKELPDAQLVFLSIKPSASRWDKYPIMEEANKKIKRYAFWHRNVKFVDVSTAMLGPDGKPRPELYLKDNLHMTPAGYELWEQIVKPYLEK